MFASIFNGIKARKQRKAAEKEQKNALQALDSQQTQLDNLFNSEYYGDYINRSPIKKSPETDSTTESTNTDSVCRHGNDTRSYRRPTKKQCGNDRQHI